MIASMTDFSQVTDPTATLGAHVAEPLTVVSDDQKMTISPAFAPQHTSPEFQENDNAIVIETKPIVPHNVVLGGTPYKVLPVKKLAMMDFGERLEQAGEDIKKIRKELDTIVTALFGRQVAPQVLARMTDPADPLDLEHIMELIKRLVERATGNPTSSPSAS